MWGGTYDQSIGVISISSLTNESIDTLKYIAIFINKSLDGFFLPFSISVIDPVDFEPIFFANSLTLRPCSVRKASNFSPNLSNITPNLK